MARDKILVVGGAFNPPTISHIEIPLLAARQLGMNSILYLPVGNGYNKSTLIDIEHRKNMLQIAINNSIKKRLEENPKDNIQTYIDFLEAYHYRTLSTVESLDILEREWNADMYFFCGSDNLATLPYWDSAKELLSHHHIITISRDCESIDLIVLKNDLLKKAYKEKHIINFWLSASLTEKHSFVSSTHVRRLLNSSLPLDEDDKKYLDKVLDKDVLKYIKENNLYNE